MEMAVIIWFIVIFWALATAPILVPFLLIGMVIERFEAKKRSRARRAEKLQQDQLKELQELRKALTEKTA